MAIARAHPLFLVTRFLAVIAVIYGSLHAIYLYTQISGGDPDGKQSLILLIIIQLMPFIVGLVQMHITFLGFVLLNHCITFSLAKYNSIFNVRGLSQVPFDARFAVSELLWATTLIIAGYLIVSMFVWLRVNLKRRREMITIRLPNKQLLIIGAIVLTSSIVNPLLPGAMHQLHDLTYVMCLILLLSSDPSGSKLLHQSLIFGSIFNMSHTLVEKGSLVDFGHFAVILFVRSCMARNIKGVAGVVFLVLLGLFIQPIKGVYRVQSRSGDFSFIEKMGMLGDLVSWRYFTEEGWASHKKMSMDGTEYRTEGDGEFDEQYLNDDEGGAFSALSEGFTRVHDDSFERTLLMTPSRVPFWEGETYSNMLYMFIPRFLWPDKPSWKHWHKFGKAYGYLAPNDDQTSVSFSMFAEAYMNFGFDGLYLISFAFGMILAIVERTAFAIFGGAYIFAYISLLTPLMNYSADLGIMLNREVIVIVSLLFFRPFLMRNIIGDEYS